MRRPARALPELWMLTALSAVSRFWALFIPRAVVFDEAHYERFAGYYLNGSYFFDVHPPLGRLLFTAEARAFGVGAITLTSPLPAPSLRILTALAGTLLVPLVFVLLRQLGASRRAATLAGVAVLLDNALLVMSRLILPDILLIAFGLAAVCAFLEVRGARREKRTVMLAGSAFLAGCALSVKWTGASALGVIMAAWFVETLVERAPVRRILGEGVLLVAIPAAVYAAMWAIHFALLTHSGPGDAFMTARFQAQLPGTAQYSPAAERESFPEKLREVHKAIRYGNGALVNATHPGASKWYTWPTMKHPMGLWEDARRPDGSRRAIVLLGNPVVWWAGLAMFFVGIWAFAARRERFASRQFGFLLLVGAVLLNYLPFIAIRRLMYLYHYLFALTLLIALAAYVADAVFQWDDAAPWRWPTRRSAAAFAATLLVVTSSFIYFLPLTFGWLVSAGGYDARFWVLHPHF